jgi:DNA polymerase-1
MIYLITNQRSLFDRLSTDIGYADLADFYLYFKNHNEVAVDTETHGFDVYTKNLITVQVGDEKNQFIIDCTTVDISLLKDFFEREDLLFLFHNAKFDLRFFLHRRILIKKVYDTFLAEATINKGRKTVKKALDAVAYRYCKVELDKTVRGVIHRELLTTRVLKYAADDVKYLITIKRKQLQKIKEQELETILSLENKFVIVLAYVEYSGLYLNTDKWKAKIAEDRKEFEQAKKELDKWIIDNNLDKYINKQLNLFSSELTCYINWSSSHQVIPLLKDLGINTQVIDDKTGQLKDSCEAKVLITQIDKSTFVPLYLKYKKLEKINTTYGDNFLKQINPISGRIHTTFTQIMDTGRMSSGGKNKDTGEDYINAQNIPADERTRSCFTASSDCVLINSDFSGQEQIVFANWSMDKDLLDFYDKGLDDMHSFVASKIYPELSNLSLQEIKQKYPDKRQIAKKAGFAINYGGNGATIAENVNISKEEGEAVYNAYFKAFPGIKSYFNKVSKLALQRGYIQFNDITKNKSYIDFFPEFKRLERQITSEFWQKYREHKEKNTTQFIQYYKPFVKQYFKYRGIIERKSYNYPIQGSSAEITKIAGIYVYEELLKRNLLFKVHFSNLVHDELLLETPKELGIEVAKIVEDNMIKAGKVYCKRVPLTAKAIISDIWEH